MGWYSRLLEVMMYFFGRIALFLTLLGGTICPIIRSRRYFGEYALVSALVAVFTSLRN